MQLHENQYTTSISHMKEKKKKSNENRLCFLQFCWEIRTNTQTELEIVTMGVMDHYLIEGRGDVV